MAGQGISTRAKLIVLTAVLASLLEIIDTAIVNVAIPSMMGNLGATLDEISWVVTGYIIANAIILPIAGWMSEQFGRKRYYTTCILIFTAASVACGLAPTLPMLVVFRVIQGLAGGALLPTSQALIYESFPREQAGMASAIYGMSVMIGPTIGPTLGGYLTDHFGWRSIFNVNLPIGLAVATLSYLLVEDVGFVAGAKPALVSQVTQPSQKRQRTPVDWLGLFFLVVGVGSLQFVLERGHAEDWFNSGMIVAFTFAAVVCLTGLVWWELKTKHPILQLRHFLNNNFRYGVLLMAAIGAMLYGLIFMVPIFVTTVQGLTATQTGMLFIPGALASAAMMPFIGSQLRKTDPRRLILVGILGMAFGIFLVSRFDSQTSVEGMFWPLLIRGAAMAYLFVPINTTVLSQFSGAAIGEAAGMLNLSRQIGGSIFIAMLSTLFQQYQVKDLAVLSSHVTWFDPMAVQARSLLNAGMSGKMQSMLGVSPTSQVALKALYYRVSKEAFVLSFQRSMFIAAVIFLFSLLLLLRMKKPRPMQGPASAH